MVIESMFCVPLKCQQLQCSIDVLRYACRHSYKTIIPKEVLYMQKKQTHNKRGRPVLDEQQKVDREILKQKFLDNSIEALETILNIMRYSMDVSARLKASCFILNKVVPEGFVFDDVIDRNITVNIVTQKDKQDTRPFEEQEYLIKEAESDVFEEDDSWGTDLYTPK